MYETYVTIQGWVGSEVGLRDAGGSQLASFRVACTPRRFDRKTETWVDEQTQWYSISAWRALAENCATSLNVGDPVVIYGKQRVSVWRNNQSGLEVTSLEIDAITVGHDLARGTSAFERTPRPEADRMDAPAGTPGLPGLEDGSGVEESVGTAA